MDLPLTLSFAALIVGILGWMFPQFFINLKHKLKTKLIKRREKILLNKLEEEKEKENTIYEIINKSENSDLKTRIEKIIDQNEREKENTIYEIINKSENTDLKTRIEKIIDQNEKEKLYYLNEYNHLKLEELKLFEKSYEIQTKKYILLGKLLTIFSIITIIISILSIFLI